MPRFVAPGGDERKMARVPFAEMQDSIAAAFVNAGMNLNDAQLCARIHTESSCDGVNSHGVNRVARFVDYAAKGWVNLKGRPELVRQVGAIEVYDGQRAPGILNALFATDRAMQVAGEQGVGVGQETELQQADAHGVDGAVGGEAFQAGAVVGVNQE